MATPPRVDSYSLIHKALRSELFSLGVSLGNGNFADVDVRAEWIGSFRRTMGFLAEHSTLEDGHIEAALRQADEQLAVSIRAQHHTLANKEAELAELVTTLEQAEGMGAVAQAAALHRAYQAFVADYLGHLSREESEANAALQAKFSDQELLALRARVQSELPPPRFAEWLHILLPAMNHQERVGMLGAMKASAPAPVYEKVSGLARGILGEEGWAQVAAELPS